MGRDVRAWAELMLESRDWPWADYRELMRLTVIALGGSIPNFEFQLPGADHHARWMSKCIYFIKLKLLDKVFQVTEEEKSYISEISTFVLVFYVKSWFEAPLSTAAARNDLSFMANIMKLKTLGKSKLVFAVMKSCYRHCWYLVPQTVILALADTGLSDAQRENMARKLHSLERKDISIGKPHFPHVDWSGEEITLPDLSSFVTADSWLVFNMLGLAGPQDWLTIPAVMWEHFAEYRKFKIKKM